MNNKKRIIVLILALAMLVSIFAVMTVSASAATTKTYFLDPGPWNIDGAKFVAYFWNSSGNEFVAMNDSDGDGIYECEVSSFYTKVIFLRKSQQTLDWKNEWNRVGDITIPTENDNLCTVTGWNTTSYKWSHKCISDSGTVTASPTCTSEGAKAYKCTVCAKALKTETIAKVSHNFVDGACSYGCGTTSTTVYAYNYKNWSSMYCYCWGVDESGKTVVDYYKAWPGEKMIHLGNGLWSYEMPTDCNRVIFSDGTLSAVENDKKTVNLVYPGENKVYDTKSTIDYWADYYPGQYGLSGNFMNLTWGTQYVDIPVGGNIISWNLALRNGDFEFKITREGYVWYGNEGTFQDTTEATSDTGWTMDYDANNCHFSAKGGSYVFTYNIATNALSVHRHIYVDGVCTGKNCNDVIDNAIELQGAINQAVYDDDSSDTIKLLADIDLTDVIVSDKYFVKSSSGWVPQNHHLYIPEGGSVILDVNGQHLTSQANETCNILLVTDGSSLVLTDTADTKGYVKANATGGSVIRSFGGNVTLEGGVVVDSDNYTHYTVYSTNVLGHNNGQAVNSTNALLTVTNATVHSGFGCLQIVGNSTANVEGGFFYMDEDSNNPTANQQNIIYLASGSTLVINGGRFESLVSMKGAAVVAESKSYITINGGYFDGPSMSIQSRADSVITLKGGSFINSFSYGGDTGPGAIENLIDEQTAYVTITSTVQARSGGAVSNTRYFVGERALANAIAVANPGDVITLETDINFSDGANIGVDRSVIIDLNGFEINGSIVNNGTLVIVDKVGNGSIKYDGATTIVNNGSIFVRSLTSTFDVDINDYLPEGYLAVKSIDGKFSVVVYEAAQPKMTDVDGVKYWFVGGINTGIKADYEDVASARINASLELVVTLDDGSVVNLGSIRGAENEPEVEEPTPDSPNPDEPDSDEPAPEQPNNPTPDEPTDDNSQSGQEGEGNLDGEADEKTTEESEKSEEKETELDHEYKFLIVVCSSFIAVILIAALAGLATRRRYF